MMSSTLTPWVSAPQPWFDRSALPLPKVSHYETSTISFPATTPGVNHEIED